MHDAPPKLLVRYADLVVRRPGTVLITLAVLTCLAGWATTKLTINSNQLDLISQELVEVKDVKRVIDMVGGSGFLMLALRSGDRDQMKHVADDVSEMLRADTANVRNVTHKQPIDFIRDNMVLFVKTEDLLEVKSRVMAVLRDRIRRANPFFMELRPTKPKELDLEDIIQKYSSVAKKSIRDEYYVSDDGKMLLMLIKPMWDATELSRTDAFLKGLNQRLAEYSKTNPHGVTLVEDYDLMGDSKTIAYGYTGTYKTSLDDSFAIASSLEPVTILAFALIFAIIAFFFRGFFPSVVVMIGVTIGTILCLGVTWLLFHELNMVTSMLAGILMGFGVDFGIHLTFRTRIELGQGKPYDQALHDAITFAGRPAGVAAVVTGGSFLLLVVSEFKGFSQFGLVSGIGTLILALTMFSFCGATISLLGRINPNLPKRLIGTMELPKVGTAAAELRIPRPGLVLLVSAVIVGLLCVVALPLTKETPPTRNLPFGERIKYGVRFNYNSRALMPEDQYSVKLQDEINRRFQISSDPTAIYTKDLAGAKEVYDEIQNHRDKYPSIDSVVSVYTFVPPPEIAAKNAEVLAQWKTELADIDREMLPEDLQKHVPWFERVLDAKPFGVDGVPEQYLAQFRNLPQAKPENQGYLTFIYPRVDLWDGRQMLEFSDETHTIKTASGAEYRSAGSPILYAILARIVLWDGQVTLIITAIWILLMHFLDFRSVKLALASVVPLGVGLLMLLGIMTMLDERLNFMNIIMLPILLGFGVSHGLYLLHRFLEGTSPLVALRSVGGAVASSTLTTVAGFGALFIASHQGLKSMGLVTTLGLMTTLLVSFTVLAAVLQILHDQRRAAAGAAAAGAAAAGAAAAGAAAAESRMAMAAPEGGGGGSRGAPTEPQP